ncbi:MAG: flavodoxin [Aggregatilineales bacterium]
MVKIGLIYGSSTGNTETAAYQIKEKMEALPTVDAVEVHNIGAIEPAQILGYQYLIMGIPTWNTGELQDDWAIFFPKLGSMDFKGKKVALFGLGDQNGYGFNFLDAMGVLGDELIVQGADLAGYWSRRSYDFAESLAIDGDFFMGLGLDNDGQADMTDKRIDKWVAWIKEDFGI